MVTTKPPVPGADDVVVRQSGVHGRGLFARRPFAKGERVIEYAGHRLTKKQALERTMKSWERGTTFVFELNKRYDIDGTPLWNKARYANHSCDPNCEAENTGRAIYLVALRAIKEGDEITFDYNFPFEEPPLECRCGAKKCRGYVVGDEAVPELRRWLRRNR